MLWLENLREALDLGCGKLSSIEECTKVYPEFMVIIVSKVYCVANCDLLI